MRKIVFELCAETIDACLAARDGGANRIELCSGLGEGGLTPSYAFIRAAIEQSGLPVHVLVRPRGAGFLYSSAEVAIMCDDITQIKSLGAAGVVLGMLRADNTVDVAGTRRLVEVAGNLKVTFHRAFDSTPSLPSALEDVIATGCERILTSGGKPNVVAGAESLGALFRQADGRIDIAVGGGLRLQNAASLSRLTGATHFHGSLRRRTPIRSDAADDPASKSTAYIVEATTVRAVIQRLQNA